MQQQQRGGTLLGFIIGLVVGLGAALAVAVYVTKVPIPFVNKASTRTAEQDAAEAQKNKEWDPNTPLYGKNPAKAAAPASVPQAVPAAAATPDVSGQDAAHQAEAAKTAAAVTAPAAPAKATAAKTGSQSADPLGDLAKASAGKAAALPASAAAAADPFQYFVQLGAFRTAQDAEAQRAKWSLAGVQTHVSEREQSGRMVYRVRVGPIEQRDEAEKLKQKLDAIGAETALVRVQR